MNKATPALSGRNLKGLRILNTRSITQGIALNQAITAAKGVSIHLPAFSIEPTGDNWLRYLPDLSKIHQAIFISSNAVDHFCMGLQQQQLTWSNSIKTTSIGKASAAALEKWNIRVDNVPLIADSEHLVQVHSLQEVQNQTIVLVKGEAGRMEIENTLVARGAKVIPLVVYRRVLPQAEQKHIESLWHDDLVDIILFTSQQAMNNIFTLFGQDAHSWLCSKPCLVISERLAEEAAKLGLQTIIISQYDTILHTLEHYNQGQTHDNEQ